MSKSIETVANEVVEPSSDSDAYILYLPEPSADPACLTLFEESIERGVLVVPFDQPLKTGGVYSMHLQPGAASHPGRARIMHWFARQTGERHLPAAP